MADEVPDLLHHFLTSMAFLFDYLPCMTKMRPYVRLQYTDGGIR